MELTYEDLKDILEMSGTMDSDIAGEIIEAMNKHKYPPTVGNVFIYCKNSGDWLWVINEADALIEAHRQYTSGKLDSTEEVEILRAELASARSACKDKDARIEALTAALEPFAEDPDTLAGKSCHAGICSKEECKRCSAAIAAWEALHPIKKELEEK